MWKGAHRAGPPRAFRIKNQDAFVDYLKSAVEVYVSTQPNLDRDCKTRLPGFVLAELQSHIQTKP